MKTALTSEIVVASPIDDATASRRILHRAGLVISVSLLCAGLDPDGFAQKVQNDADELNRQTAREVEKHPEKKVRAEFLPQTIKT